MERFDLGTHTRPISTGSSQAQAWFDRGLNWCFGFNHEAGVKCFQKALEFDSECVMAHWGVAYGSGPFYNFAWREFGEQEAAAVTALAHAHIERARACYRNATESEQELVEALARRFQRPHPVAPEEYDRWDDDYAAAMRRVHRLHPDDFDIMALFAEALITRTPRRLWNVKTGKPAVNSDALEAMEVCERAIAMADRAGIPPHAAILHLHIHVMEMSNEPERAMRSADLLCDMCPDAGHMNHMPGHIYVLCGEYEKAKIVSEKAIRADDMFGDYSKAIDFYLTARCHDIHLMMFTCMFLGQYGPAIAAADKMQSMLTRDVLGVQGRPKLAMTTEGYYSTRMHVLVRFGRWQEIIDEPAPEDPVLCPVSMVMHHYGRGVAFASLKQIAQAEEERRRFHESLRLVPKTRRYLSNWARDTLGVAEKMLDGELEYHKGNFEAAFEHLRDCVTRDDNLGYTEPWAWMHPPRHALAALLAEQGQYVEAEQVYRDDLGLSGRVQRCTQHPDNVWALHGLVECLEQRGDVDELEVMRRKLEAAQARADVVISSSCLCRVGVRSAESCCSGTAAGER
jgi:tetratricopeptide (TPR) repeat protein